MGKDRQAFLNTFFATQVNFVVLYTAVITFLGLGDKEVLYVPCLSLFFAAFLFYGIRKYTRSIWVFALGHGAAAGACFLFPHPDGWYRFIFMAEAAILISYSVYVKFSREKQEDKPMSPAGAGVLIVGMSLMQFFYGNREILTYYPYCMGIYFIYHFITGFLEDYRAFLMANKKNRNCMPYRQIRAMSTAAIGFFCLLLAVISGSIARGKLNATLPKSNFLKDILQRFLKFITANKNSIENTVKESREEMLGEGETPFRIVWQILNQVILFIKPFVFLFLICVFAFLIYKLIRRIFGVKANMHTQAYSPLVTEEKETLRRGSGLEKKKQARYFGAAGRIRHLYKKLVAKESTLHKQEHTAREYLQHIYAGTQTKEKAVLFAALYEKARYSGENCTSEDAKQAGKLYRELLRPEKQRQQ